MLTTVSIYHRIIQVLLSDSLKNVLSTEPVIHTYFITTSPRGIFRGEPVYNKVPGITRDILQCDQRNSQCMDFETDRYWENKPGYDENPVEGIVHQLSTVSAKKSRKFVLLVPTINRLIFFLHPLQDGG